MTRDSQCHSTNAADRGQHQWVCSRCPACAKLPSFMDYLLWSCVGTGVSQMIDPRELACGGWEVMVRIGMQALGLVENEKHGPYEGRGNEAWTVTSGWLELMRPRNRKMVGIQTLACP